jgi:hypothetical protein
MTVTVVQPKLVQALVALFKGEATGLDAYRTDVLTALRDRVSVARVDTKWNDAWQNPMNGRIYNAIEVIGDGGLGLTNDRFTIGNTMQERALIRGWSSTMEGAKEIAYLCQQLVFPPIPGAPMGFIAVRTHVEQCLGVTSPMEWREPDANEYMNGAQFVANFRVRRLVTAA